MTAKESELAAVVESPREEAFRLCGQMLLAKRQSLGWSETTVAEKLNLLPSVVKILEAGNFSAIRSPVFCRGYLKNYAKLLDLNVDELMGLYDSHLPMASPVQSVVTDTSVVFKPVVIGESTGWRAGPVALSTLAAVSLSVVGFLVFSGSGNAIDTSSVMQATTVAAVASEKVSDAAASDREEDVVAMVAPALVNQSHVASMPILLPGNDIHIADYAGRQVASSEAPLKVETASLDTSHMALTNEDKLTLRFTDNCWVEIRDSKNAVIASGLYRANDVLNLTGKAPFKLHLGFAPGVNVAFNGEKVDVQKGVSTGHTARLVVGST